MRHWADEAHSGPDPCDNEFVSSRPLPRFEELGERNIRALIEGALLHIGLWRTRLDVDKEAQQ